MFLTFLSRQEFLAARECSMQVSVKMKGRIPPTGSIFLLLPPQLFFFFFPIGGGAHGEAAVKGIGSRARPPGEAMGRAATIAPLKQRRTPRAG